MRYNISIPDAVITACFLMFFVFLVLILLYAIVKCIAFVAMKIDNKLKKNDAK